LITTTTDNAGNTTTNTYNALGELTKTTGLVSGAQQTTVMAYTADGQILQKTTSVSGQTTNEVTNYLYAQDNGLGSEDNLKGINVLATTGGFSNGVLGTQGYTVQSGDTLDSVAQQMYGDSRYAYLIAQANGLQLGSPLTVGMLLHIPQATTATNASNTFQPYAQSAIVSASQSACVTTAQMVAMSIEAVLNQQSALTQTVADLEAKYPSLVGKGPRGAGLGRPAGGGGGGWSPQIEFPHSSFFNLAYSSPIPGGVKVFDGNGLNPGLGAGGVFSTDAGGRGLNTSGGNGGNGGSAGGGRGGSGNNGGTFWAGQGNSSLSGTTGSGGSSYGQGAIPPSLTINNWQTVQQTPAQTEGNVSFNFAQDANNAYAANSAGGLAAGTMVEVGSYLGGGLGAGVAAGLADGMFATNDAITSSQSQIAGNGGFTFDFAQDANSNNQPQSAEMGSGGNDIVDPSNSGAESYNPDTLEWHEPGFVPAADGDSPAQAKNYTQMLVTANPDADDQYAGVANALMDYAAKYNLPGPAGGSMENLTAYQRAMYAKTAGAYQAWSARSTPKVTQDLSDDAIALLLRRQLAKTLSDPETARQYMWNNTLYWGDYAIKPVIAGMGVAIGVALLPSATEYFGGSRLVGSAFTWGGVGGATNLAQQGVDMAAYQASDGVAGQQNFSLGSFDAALALGFFGGPIADVGASLFKDGLNALFGGSVPDVAAVVTVPDVAPDAIPNIDVAIDSPKVDAPKVDLRSVPNTETPIVNDVLDQPRVGYGLKGEGSGNKVDQVSSQQVVGADGQPIPVYENRPNGPYAYQEFPAAPQAHGFPEIVDNYAGDATQFPLTNGSTLYQVPGSLNGTSGRFEWIVDPNLGGVSHRMFVQNGSLNGVPSRP
jgi:hypothetical protein